MIEALFPILLLTAAQADELPSGPEWNCADPQAQQEMNACALQEFEAADAELIYQWKDTSTQMQQYDEEADPEANPGDERPGFFDTLIEAQTAWLAYREAHCRSDGYQFRGGSMEPLIVATCMTALTRQRIAQLKALMSEELPAEE
jgi:uncharacterized protein YecT (DUF1311 family)